MGTVKSYAIGLAAVLAAFAGDSGRCRAADPVELREAARPGATSRAEIKLKAQGQYIAAAPPGATKEQTPKPLELKVESELNFVERVLAVDDRGRATRGVRRVFKAGSAVNGEVRPATASVRPAVALVVAESRGDGVVVYSPLGPLTRPELEVLQGPGDPLALDGLLPDKPVAVGAHWKVADSAVKALSAYDTLTSHTLEATLDAVDAASARVTLRGEVRGSVLGGEGSMACNGSFSFDRKARRIDRLTLNRAEARRPGPVEGGLDIKSTLSVTRTGAEAPSELTDATLARLTLEPSPERELLLLVAPSGKYSLRHDRDWHVYWDDPRSTVLRRVERGQTVAQCNLAAGPNAGKGQHQDPAQFRDDVRKGLGSRFVQILGAGEMDGDPAGGFRYKVGVQGRQDNLGVVWYYYLIAAPNGDQLLATFTLAAPQAGAFGNKDETLIGSLRWLGADPAAGAASR